MSVTFPEDVATLRAGVHELAHYPDFVVEVLYEKWSEDYYCAGWLYLSDERIDEFRNWFVEGCRG